MRATESATLAAARNCRYNRVLVIFNPDPLRQTVDLVEVEPGCWSVIIAGRSVDVRLDTAKHPKQESYDLAAALAEGTTTLTNALFSDDSHYFADALEKLGFSVNRQAGEAAITVAGQVSGPDCHRASAGYLYTYINGRFVRDKVVQHAVLQAYRSFLERGRYPVVILNMELPAGEVDVNVHPTKHEVRFREQGRVHDAIVAAVTSALQGTPWLATRPDPAVTTDQLPPQAVRVTEVRESLARYQPRPEVRQHPLPMPIAGVSLPAAPRVAAADWPAVLPEPAEGFFTRLTIIGQFQAAYILCQDERDLIIIDQHAAHERVAFEQLKHEFGAGSVESQGLLFPETVDLPHQLSAVAREQTAMLELIGFSLESFGGTTWLLKLGNKGWRYNWALKLAPIWWIRPNQM